MSTTLSPAIIEKLESQQNLWFSSVRADGRPHLVPVWFVWFEGKLYIGTEPKSVKSKNIQTHPKVAVALEDAVKPVICEGTARPIERPWSEGLLAAFFKKYEWDLLKEEQYNCVIEISPERWLGW
jgi:F420H(2)-dependent biliverdin reductase